MKYHVNDRVKLKNGGEYDIGVVSGNLTSPLYSIKKLNGWSGKEVSYTDIIEGSFEPNTLYWNVSENEIECVVTSLPSVVDFKYSIGDSIKSKPGGFYIHDPSRWVQNLEKDLQSKNCNVTGIIGDRKYENGYNWYRLESGGNWMTEEALELVKQEEFMPHKIGTLLDYQGRLCYFAGKAALINQFIVEMKENGIGWRRDATIPSDYVSIGTDKYFYYDSNFRLVEEKPVIEEKVYKDSHGTIIKVGDYVERVSGSFRTKVGDVLKITRLYGLSVDGVIESGKIIGGSDASKFIKVDGFKKPVASKTFSTNDYLLNTKIWIGDNPELSKAVQEALFKKGFNWSGLNKIPQYTDSTSLYMWEDYSLAYDSTNSRDKFNKNSKREIFFSDLGISTIPVFEDKSIHFLWSNPVSREKTLQDPVVLKKKKKKYSLL